MILVACLIIFALIVLYLITDYAFKNILMSTRKTEKQVLDILEKRNVYTVKEYSNIKFENLEILSEDNLKLKGYYINKFPESKKLMIMVHGYTANHIINLQYINMFLEKEFNILLIDERAHGNSEGVYPTYGIMESKDLHKWIEFMKGKLGDDIEIGLHGQSMGGATVLMYGGIYNDVKFIIADCAYSDAKELMDYRFRRILKIFPKLIYYLARIRIKIQCKFDIEDASPINYIKDKEIPVLFIHGTNDMTVPHYMSEEMYKGKIGSHNKLFLVKNAEHMKAYPMDKLGYEKIVNDFLEDITN